MTTVSFGGHMCAEPERRAEVMDEHAGCACTCTPDYQPIWSGGC
jgi:hypothetical protein